MLSNLALWLNDDKGIVLEPSASTVAHWEDQSGHANVATPYAGVGTFTLDPGVVNGHDGVIASGNRSQFSVLDAPSLQFGTAGFVVGIVLRTAIYDGVVALQKDNQTGTGLSVIENSAGDYGLTLGSQSIVITPTDYVHFHFIIATGPAMTIDSDGVSTVTGPTSTINVSNAGAVLTVFDDGAESPAGQDELAEVVLAGGPVSCSDAANLVAYFTTKFAL
jgi:hypothetical protein